MAIAVLYMVERQQNAALRVFIDLKKAFNKMDHQLLLAKLEHYGVRGGAWLAGELPGREGLVCGAWGT